MSMYKYSEVTGSGVSLANLLFEKIQKDILSGEMKPGERLMEIHLANKLGVSRTPVREAIKRLIQEGLLAYTDHGNVCVKKYSIEEISSFILSLLSFLTVLETRSIISSGFSLLDTNKTILDGL